MALNKKVLAIGIGAVAVAGAVVGVVIAKAQPKGMTIAVSELPDSLNPVLEQNTSGLNANELIFDGLVNFEVDPSTGKRYTEFALAEDIVQDEKTRKNYTVTLRDVAWNDGEDGNPGTPVTSADVVYSFKAYTFEGNRSPKRDYILSFIKDVTAVDDKTVNIEFNDPIPSYKAIPVLDFKIVPSKYNGIDMNVDMRSGENERKFSQNPVGTGPFKLTSWDIGKWLTFQSNGLYFKKTPQADSLVIKRTIDPVVRKNELSKGRINVILETNPMDRPTIEKIDNVDINSFLPYAFYQIEINTSLFKSADARKAMAQALDKKNLIPSITDQESGVVINNGLYPTNIFQEAMPEYVNEPLPNLLPYDLEKAKSLASSSGLAGQNVNLIYPDSMGDFGKALAEGVANQLKEIGLNVEAKRIGNQVFN
ncbi:MAG: ABC transporter substrate-binding protein, partial [Treponema sp.]|nr:ABC transporter substrate-binding protein [Treponema sp.]